MKATKMLKTQHREVKTLFKRVRDTDDPYGRTTLLEDIAQKLKTHMTIEEKIFYPALKEALVIDEVQAMIPEAFEEHHVVKLVLAELPEVNPEDERFCAKMTVLHDLIARHIKAEERTLFKAAESLGDARLNELASEMQELASESARRLAQDPARFTVEDEELDEAEPITR